MRDSERGTRACGRLRDGEDQRQIEGKWCLSITEELFVPEGAGEERPVTRTNVPEDFEASTFL